MNFEPVDEAEETITTVDVRYIHLMRYLMNRRCVEKDKLVDMYNVIFVQDRRTQKFDETIETVNDMLQDAKMEVKEVNCEISTKPLYVVVSTLYRPDRIWPSHWTDDELEFIKRVIHEVMISGRGLVSSIQCLNFDVKLSKSDREDLLKTLLVDQWLAETKKGTLTMSALSITELEPYLRENYREILTNCAFCKRSVYFGEICSKCNVVGHRLCLKKYRQSMKKSFKCPVCRKEWGSEASCSQDEDMECS